MRLTDEQAAVVAHRGGPLLVQATAGSGKTTTTCCHVRELVREGVTSPRRVLVTTFSKRGAADMARKGRKLGVPSGVRYKTLHGVALGMIFQARESAAEMRGPENPPRELLVIGGGKDWMIRHIVKAELKRWARKLGIGFDAKRRPAGLTVGDVRRELSVAKAALVEPAEWLTARGERFPGYEEWAQDRDRDPIPPGIAKLIGKVYAELERAKFDPIKYDAKRFESHKGTSFLTFDDMVATTARSILQDAAWIAPWRGAYSWVFCDETQDNCLGQWVLVRHLSAERNLVAIGDDQQSIYAFRGAMPALMRDFLDGDPPPRLLALTANFRSRQPILDAANGVLRHADDDRLTPGVYMEPGRADAAHGIPVTVQGYDDVTEEAAHTAETIAAELEEGADPEELAVLFRTNAQAGALELELMQRAIPYRVAGRSFFNRAEVQTAMAFLRLALDELDKEAWRRAYCVPLRGLGRTFLTNYPTYQETAQEFANGGVRTSYRRGVRELVRHVEAIRGALEVGPGEALTYIAEDVGVREHYRDEDAGQDDITEVDTALAGLVACAVALDDVGVLVRYARDQDGCVEDAEGETAERRLVTCSTVHQSKGLEWARVHVVGVTRGTFPHERAEGSEERRLGYVAFSRAMEELRVSWTAKPPAGRGEGGPSALIHEAGLEPGAARAPAPKQAPDCAEADGQQLDLFAEMMRFD